MCKKTIYLCSFVLVLGLVGSASADLVAHWKFDEGAGNATNDEVGGRAADVINATWTTGLFRNSRSALEFNGSNAYVDVRGQDWGTFKQVSIAVWLKFDSLPGAYNSIFHEDWATGGIHFMVRSSGVVGFSLNGRGPNDFNSQGVLKAGEVYHVVATFDITTGQTQVYINGVLDSEGGSTPTASTIFLRSPFTIGSWNTDRYWDGVLDDLRIYSHIVTAEEVLTIMAGAPRELASTPSPEDGMTDVVRDTVLSWAAGEFANTHDVYFGTAFADVNNAVRADPRDVLVSQGQTGATYDPPGLLDFGTTYYWRIDEVNAPPASSIFKGTVWSFTTEPVAYPVAGQTIKVTASSADLNQGPENTVNSSGLTNDLHSDVLTTMWLTAGNATGPAWILYEFDRVLRLDHLWVWNHNGLLERMLGLGAKNVTIEYSINGVDYTTLGTTHEFARAAGKAGYASNTTIDLGAIAAKYVKLTINSNWGNVLKQYGLSEVRFFSVPVFAREPSPIAGATSVDVNATLSWRAGREAAKHNICMSADQQAVTDGTVAVQTVTTPAYVPTLNLGTTYYWRVDEVNDAETPSLWQGDVWSFSTENFDVVDDFESYANDSPRRLFQTWIDGAGFSADEFFPQGNKGNGTGALVGYDPTVGQIMETTIIHAGKKAMPLFYDNAASTSSETTRTFNSPQNWTEHGTKALTLWFYGNPTNVAQQMYVKINNAKILYDGEAGNLRLPLWQMWYIDLTAQSVKSVTSVSIGFDKIGGAGGAGKVLIDDLRLYPRDREQVTPKDPGTSGLQLQYQFEGNANDSSGKANNGTLQGGAAFAAGKTGQALSLDGVDDFVDVSKPAALNFEANFTWSAWIKTASDGTILARGPATGNWIQGGKALFVINGILRFDVGWVGNTSSAMKVNNDEWHHVALTTTFQTSALNDTAVMYIDGHQVQTRSNWDVNRYPEAGLAVKVGFASGNFPTPKPWFFGLIDEVRIYDRALPEEEIAWLAGQTMSFDKPF